MLEPREGKTFNKTVRLPHHNNNLINISIQHTSTFVPGHGLPCICHSKQLHRQLNKPTYDIDNIFRLIIIDAL